jgi:hypothetical protein
VPLQLVEKDSAIVYLANVVQHRCQYTHSYNYPLETSPFIGKCPCNDGQTCQIRENGEQCHDECFRWREVGVAGHKMNIYYYNWQTSHHFTSHDGSICSISTTNENPASTAILSFEEGARNLTHHWCCSRCVVSFSLFKIFTFRIWKRHRCVM